MLISEALEGKFVRSSQGEGIIQYANLRTDMWISKFGTFAYAVRVRPNKFPDFWTTIYVGIDD